MSRYGKCKSITLKGVRCKNDAIAPHGRCHVDKHKAEANVGRGVQDQLPSPIRDSGAPMDMEMPTDPEARKAHIRNKLNKEKSK